MPTYTSRSLHEGIREGRTVLYRGQPARVTAVHWSPRQLPRPHIVAADLFVTATLTRMVEVDADEIDAPAPTPANSAGIRRWLGDTAPEVLPLIGRITSSRHRTTIMLYVSAVYDVGLTQRQAAARIRDALVPAWNDSESRVAVRTHEQSGTSWVQVWRTAWRDTTPVPARAVR